MKQTRWPRRSGFAWRCSRIDPRPGDRVLGMGTGSRVNAILAASKSAHPLAVDLNPHALEALTANAGRNGVAERVEVRHSDVFSKVDGRSDLIGGLRSASPSRSSGPDGRNRRAARCRGAADLR